MIVIAALLGICAGLLQSGPLAALGDGGAAAALPGALAAGWAAVRGPREAVVLAFAAAAILGVLSEARVGLFALALLPAVAAGTLAAVDVPGRRTRSLRAALGGVWAGAGYLAVLAAAAGDLPASPSLMWGVVAAALIAGVTCAAMFPLRPHDRRLFA